MCPDDNSPKEYLLKLLEWPKNMQKIIFFASLQGNPVPDCPPDQEIRLPIGR